MQVKRLNLNYLRIFAGFALIVGVFAIFIIFYFPDYAKLKKIKEANRRVVRDAKNLQLEIKDLQEKNRKIGKDPTVYEKMAREDLRVAKEGEIVVDIKE